MAVLEILKAPNEKLRMKSKAVDDVTSIQQFIDDMLETMYSTDDGIGLAAMQVGRRESIIVIDISENRDDPLILINPTVADGENRIKGQEGCLSVPGYYADIERYGKVKVSALDRYGKEIVVESEGYLAIVMQHEIDHLRGKLFIDYLSPLKRQIALKKVRKLVNQATQSI